MGKKIFQVAFVPVLATVFFLGALFTLKAWGDLFFPAWFYQVVRISLEVLGWFSGGWFFNRILSLLFWNTLVKKI